MGKWSDCGLSVYHMNESIIILYIKTLQVDKINNEEIGFQNNMMSGYNSLRLLGLEKKNAQGFWTLMNL